MKDVYQQRLQADEGAAAGQRLACLEVALHDAGFAARFKRAAGLAGVRLLLDKARTHQIK